jgi:hypothetical protein
VVYASSSSALATGTALTFDGANLTVSGTTTSARFRTTNASGNYGWTAGSQGGIFTSNSTPGLAAQFIVDTQGRGIAISTSDDNNSNAGTQLRISLGAGTGSTTASIVVNDNTTGSINTLTIASSQLIFNRIGGESFRFGAAGQLGIGGATYGNAGEVLTSGGSGAAPTWAAAGGGSQAFVAFGSTGGF